ncbi:MAG: hydrogenase maturation protease [Deltaproteobacteria bacterium]|nr:hydrogenase maturation protease [Deltaproteobacteria bacterium]
MKHPILIVTCGNPDAGDDGFGHAVAVRLRADPLPGVTVRELGIRPADLLAATEEYGALIIVDAVSCPGEKPGALMDMDWFDPARPVLVSEAALSSHGLSLGLQLDLLRSLGMLPSEVRVVGAHIARVGMGYAMTEAVQRSVSAVAGVITQYARAREENPDD